MIDPQTVWAVVRDGRVVHIRMTKGIAEASAAIEKQVYEGDIKVVPMVLTEIAEEGIYACGLCGADIDVTAENFERDYEPLGA